MPPTFATAPPVDRALVADRGVLVAGHDGERRARVAQRHRDAGVGGHGDRRRDAGHDLEGHARLDERRRLLAATGEHERVAALQPHDGGAGAAPLDEQRVDLLLRHASPRRAPCRR